MYGVEHFHLQPKEQGMLGLSQEQILGLLRQLLPVIGTVLTATGVVKAGSWGTVETLILTIAGPLMIAGSAIWTTITNTQRALVAKVDEIAKDPKSPVLGVVTTNTPEGRDLADSMQGTTTVAAGTPEASALTRAA